VAKASSKLLKVYLAAWLQPSPPQPRAKAGTNSVLNQPRVSRASQSTTVPRKSKTLRRQPQPKREEWPGESRRAVISRTATFIAQNADAVVHLVQVWVVQQVHLHKQHLLGYKENQLFAFTPKEKVAKFSRR
jgi:hypothetical protein